MTRKSKNRGPCPNCGVQMGAGAARGLCSRCYLWQRENEGRLPPPGRFSDRPRKTNTCNHCGGKTGENAGYGQCGRCRERRRYHRGIPCVRRGYGQGLTARVVFNTTPELLLRFKTAANKAGMSWPDWIRMNLTSVLEAG